MNNELFFLKHTDTIETAISKILLNKSRTIFILQKKKVIGCLSEGDILRALLLKKNLKSPAINIMNKSFKFATVEDLKNEAKIIKIFKKNKIHLLPITNKYGNFIKMLNFYELFE
jgi:predicted transcriptional regulator